MLGVALNSRLCIGTGVPPHSLRNKGRLYIRSDTPDAVSQRLLHEIRRSLGGDCGMSEIDRMVRLSQTTYRLEMLWERCKQERQRGPLDDAIADLVHKAVVENLAAIIAVIPDRPKLQRLPWVLQAVWFAIRRGRLDLALEAVRATAA